MKRLLVILMALLCTSFSGCLLKPTAELYALPRQSEEYYDLQRQLEAVLHDGASYCAPVSGGRRQAVQLVDLDSDGQDEAVAFFQTIGEKPLKIYIYKKHETGYERYAVIEGDGSAFASVDYCQIDAALGLELVVERQISDQVPQTLSVYSFADGRVAELLNVSSIGYTKADLDQNGLQELLIFRRDESTSLGVTDYYCWVGEMLDLAGSADMTTELRYDSIRRIVCGMMQEGQPAVFVANAVEETSVATDVYTLHADGFKNVSAAAENASDASHVRYRGIYATDIDADGLIELPETVKLPKHDESEGLPYYKIRWYNVGSNGKRTYKRSTFHNYIDGWYIDIPNEWEEGLVVDYVRDDQQLACYRFSYRRKADGASIECAAIYSFSGSDAERLADSDGRFVLARKGDAVYAGKIFHEHITQQQLKDVFHFIFTDWNSGEV